MRSEVAIGTGMRRGDQLNLRLEKIDFQRNVIHVPNSKTGRDYTVPMNQDVRNELLALRKLAAKGDYVFTNPSTGKSFTEIKRAFHTACRLAGIDNLRWHDLPPCAMLRKAPGTTKYLTGWTFPEISQTHRWDQAWRPRKR